jgi:ABC-type glycerol-3-phosphate transport system substrate-binding protein
LQVWVPPEFDPGADSAAARLLAARLEEFEERRPGVQVQVRVKAPDGPGGLLDSLTTASAAAPLAMPDLVALPRPVLEAAALKGLLHPYDTLSQAIDDPDWYEFARQLARLQDSTFGLPFAGDALHLVYRPGAVPTPPGDMAGLLAQQTPLAFPAADPETLFALALYLSAGGSILDGQGRPHLDRGPLAEALNFYAQAAAAGIFPDWLTQMATDEQAWTAFQEGRSNLVVTWVSRYLKNPPADAQVAHLPTLSGVPSTLANGWVWALAGTQADRQGQAVELAEFLTDSRFLAEWNAAAGYLPPRPSALAGVFEPEPGMSPTATIPAVPTGASAEPAGAGQAGVPPPSLPTILHQIALSARLYPPADILISVGPPLQEAVLGVLRGQLDPASAAQAAVDRLNVP